MLQNVTVARTRLLETLQENREKHVAAYDEAVVHYRDEVLKALRERIEIIEAGKRFDLRFALPEPVSYVNEYDRAIGMVEWSTEDEIELSEYDFRAFVLDEWDFSGHFLAATSVYNGR